MQRKQARIERLPFSQRIRIFFSHHYGKIFITGLLLLSIGIFSALLFPIYLSLALLFSLFWYWKPLFAFFFLAPFLTLFGIRKKNGMNRYLYRENSCFDDEGNLIGKLFYERDPYGIDQPVLELYTEDYHKMGYAQGILLGPYLEDLIIRVLSPMMRICSIMTWDILKGRLEKKAHALEIPAEYDEELDGLLEGMGVVLKRHGIGSKIDRKRLLIGNVFMDLYKAIGRRSFLRFFIVRSLGCSLAVLKKDGEFILGRTLDWPSFGILGSYAIIKRYKIHGKEIEMHTVPGILGAISAFSRKGLVVVINECSCIARDKGIPYLLFARLLIENCNSTEEAEQKIHGLKKAERLPASSFHLTVVDKSQGINFQFFPNLETDWLERRLNHEGTLLVTNHAIDEKNQVIENTIANPGSIRRYEILRHMIKNESINGSSGEEILRRSLKAASTIETVSAIIFRFNGETIAPRYVNDDYFAGDHLV